MSRGPQCAAGTIDLHADPAQALRARDFEAAVFDLDGVVTRTASVHAAAWKELFDAYLKQVSAGSGKPFRPFDAEEDYRRYVDGKPRYEGVKSFLESRGITLPYGDPGDPPERETICGLGNRKNALFRERLAKDGVEVFDSSVWLIRALRERGFKTALVSSSKNAKAVLEAAGLTDLFDAIVDGVEAARLGLKGKPDPDIFLRAAEVLGVAPEHALAVEDAIAGVEAARAGGFGLVIGVDRAGEGAALRAHGAHLVVRDLGELHVRPQTAAERCTTLELPNAIDHWEEIAGLMAGRRPAVFLDYDGTLTPIVERPELAVLSDEMRATIKELACLCTVAVVSGRDRADVQALVGLDELVYAGSHGFDIAGPEGLRIQHEQGTDYLPALARAHERLREALEGIEGVLVERKRFAIAVHFRQVAEVDVDRVEAAVDEVVERFPKLRKTYGKKIFELRPRIDWDKGKAVLWLLEALGLEGEDVLPLYLGDDVTDEDAFAALRGRGIGILVAESVCLTAARYVLRDPEEVARFLHRLVGMLKRRDVMSEWQLIYQGFEPGQEGLREALCTLGNGYFATRGAAEEAEADDIHYPGTYLAGGYNRLQTDIAGRVIENEDLVNMPNWLSLSFRPEGGDWFNLRRVEILAYRQELDLEKGVLARHVRFRDRDGRETTLVSRRLVHMSRPHLAAIEMRLRPENWSGRVEIRSAIDGRVINAGVERYRQLSSKHLEPRETDEVGADGILLVAETNQSHIRVAQAAQTRVYQEDEPLPVKRRTHQEQDYIRQDLPFEVAEGQEVSVEKIVAFYTSRDHAISEPGLEAGKAIGEAGRFRELLQSHSLAWRQLWRRCDIVLEGQERTQMILRLHIFHLLQTASLNTVDLDVGVPARGLHGEAYRGHVFWDELFIFPFLDFRIPEITRALLMYRYRRLPEARRMAKEAGFAGAMYPWQSGSNGREESQVLHLNPRSGRWLPDDTHLQRHVNAAIAYNVWRHYEITGDQEFLLFCGAEMILEIARFWASIATWNAGLGRYEVKGIVGPDEFHTRYPWRDEPGLDNNAYTNVMAAWVLARAPDVLDLLEDERRQEIKESLGLADEELARWDEISRKMRVVFHGDGIISQFEDYDRLEELDWEGYRKRYGDIHRLDRILEAEGDTVNRYQASKQADVLMLFYLFSADELRDLFARLGYPFERETIPKNIDYYIHRTSHGSTLSRVVHSWVLARSDRARSWQLLAEALESDVADIQGGTTREGIHLGAMAGTVDLVQRGHTGLEIRRGLLRLNPCVPPELQRLRLRVRYRGQWLELEISCEAMTVRTPPGWTGPNRIAIHDEVREFQPGETLRFTCRPSQEQALPRTLAETSAG